MKKTTCSQCGASMAHRTTLCHECGYEHELGYTVEFETPQQKTASKALLPSWFFLAAALVGLFLLVLTIADQSWGAAAFFYLGDGLVGVGLIWAVVLAFQDEVLDGFLCLLCTFYLIYYVMIEWRACRPAVFTGMLGLLLIVAGAVMQHYFVESVV